MLGLITDCQERNVLASLEPPSLVIFLHPLASTVAVERLVANKF
jgi:hypothetical protein